jgi:cell wall-associated NlpC family hydrolase
MLTNSTKFNTALFCCLFAMNISAQNIRFDRLEQLFDQGYFKLVYRKSNQLLNDPSYDYSLLPRYYKAISILELAQHKKWRQRHESEFQWAVTYLLDFKKQQKGQQILRAHQTELQALYNDIAHHIAALTGSKSDNDIKEWKQFSTAFFSDFTTQPRKTLEFPTYSPEALQHTEQQALINEAQKHIGVSYLTAGADPAGFDCSGFTMYVFSKQGINLPRRASEQFNFAQKISPEEAQFGDLVFFSNGGDINHVGILINEKGAPKKMIHASSSLGISVADIEQMTYWKNRISGFGRVLNLE